MTGGPSPLGSERGRVTPTLILAASELPPPGPATPVSVVTVPWPRNERGALAGLKTISYGENVRALEPEDEEHLCRPASDPFHLGQRRDHFFIRHCVDGIERNDASRHLEAEVAKVGRLLTADAGGAELLVRKAREGLG